VFEVGEDDGVSFVVMEFLRGRSLPDRLGDGEPLTLEDKLDVVIQVCDGLQSLHENGVVHGDVRPANVWLLDDGGVKLLHLGFANHGSLTLTEQGDVIGSVAYMAPEKLSGAGVDGRADIFSAGVVLHELLTGRRPFQADSITGVMMKVLHEPPPDIRKIVPDLPDRVSRAVEAALRKDPDERYAQAADFAADLRLARAGIQAPLEEEASSATLWPSQSVDATLAKASPSSRRTTGLEGRDGVFPDPELDAPGEASPAAPARPSSTVLWKGWTRLKQAVRGLGGRSAGTSLPGLYPPPLPEPVLLGASAPRGVRPGQTMTAQFVAYVQRFEGAVRQQLTDLAESPDDARLILGVPPNSRSRWAVGAPVTVQVRGRHLAAEPPYSSFEWNGERNLVSVLVAVDAAAPQGTTHLCFEAFIGPVSVAFIVLPIAISIEQRDTTPTTTHATPFSTAFASYASADAVQVSLGLSWLKRWDTGLEIFQDCLDLQPNAAWKQQLETVIPQKDVFLLFWSVNAMKSPWVRWELEMACRAKPSDAIRPMPLDDPSVAPPPEELKHLQFRDRYLMARQAFLRIVEGHPGGALSPGS
jgi:hypothetical protein